MTKEFIIWSILQLFIVAGLAVVHGIMLRPRKVGPGRTYPVVKRWPKEGFYPFWNVVRVLLFALSMYVSHAQHSYLISGTSLYVGLFLFLFPPLVNVIRGTDTFHMGGSWTERQLVAMTGSTDQAFSVQLSLGAFLIAFALFHAA